MEYCGVGARLSAADRRELRSDIDDSVLLTVSGDIAIERRPVADLAVSMRGLDVELMLLAPLPAAAA
jgi:hypothetical protein